MTIPNTFPKIDPGKQRIAFLGTPTNVDEVTANEIIVGNHGKNFYFLMSYAGLSSQCVFKGSLNDTLKSDIEKFNPNIIVLLGDDLLNHAKQSKKLKSRFWRGSLFLSHPLSLFPNRKCLSSLALINVFGGWMNKRWVYGDYALIPLLKFDFKRAVAESSSHELILPIRHIRVDLSYADIINVLSILRANHTPVATDIEGRLDTMSCISFASSAVMAFTVPFFRKDGSSVWTVTEECNILRAVAGLLEDPTVPKILQNCLYDTFVLQYSYRICIRNIIDDTMLKHWSLYAELRKSLALQTSIYTKEPYYKHERLQETEQEEE